MTTIRGTRMPNHGGTIYEYPSSPEEDQAAATLRERGWHVSPPPCPDCRGSGYVNFHIGPAQGTGTRKDPIHYETSWEPCPRGCPVPAMIL